MQLPHPFFLVPNQISADGNNRYSSIAFSKPNSSLFSKAIPADITAPDETNPTAEILLILSFLFKPIERLKNGAFLKESHPGNTAFDLDNN